MPQMDRVSVRLTKAQVEYLRALAAALHIEKADVIRLAITRLAQWEGVAPAPPVLEFLRTVLQSKIE
jgi:hypothetical protein